MKQYKLINGELVGVPEREEPNWDDDKYFPEQGGYSDQFMEDCKEYQKYLDSLPTYSLSEEMKEWCEKNPKDSYPESDFKLDWIEYNEILIQDNIVLDGESAETGEWIAVPNKPDEKDGCTKIIQMKEDSYFDMYGNEIMEGDLLKVYHFREAYRRKKHYMYHIAILKEHQGKQWWMAKMYHVSENKGHYNLRAVADNETRVIHGTVVIDSKDAMRELRQTLLSRTPNPEASVATDDDSKENDPN